MSSTEELSLNRGICESIHHMSDGRSPKPRQRHWRMLGICTSIALYVVVLGALAASIYIGMQAVSP